MSKGETHVAVAAIVTALADTFAFLVAEVIFHFALKAPFNNCLGELFEKTTLREQLLRVLAFTTV